MPPYVNVAWGKFYWRDFLLSAMGKALGCCFGLCVDQCGSSHVPWACEVQKA